MPPQRLAGPCRRRVTFRTRGPSLVAQPHASPDSRESVSGLANPETLSIDDGQAVLDRDRQKLLWKKAIKLPMYWVAVIPVTVGTCLAFFEFGKASMSQATALVAGAALIIAWLNLSNDAFDAETSVDETKPESVVNLTGNRNLVLLGSIAAFIAGTGVLATSLGSVNYQTSLALLAFSVACGYVYQGPPFRWSYKGWGEPLCFFAFGPSATTAFFLAMSSTTVALRSVPASVWVASIVVGITTAIVLFCSHFHQHDGDKAAGKMSPIVKLGSTALAVEVLRWSCMVPFGVLVVAVAARLLPWTVLVSCGVMALPKATHLVSFAEKNHRDLATIARLKVVALSLHSSLGVALGAGLVLARAIGL